MTSNSAVDIGTDSDTVEIGRTAYELLEFELHLLRGIVGALWVDATLASRNAKLGRLRYQAALERALCDPGYRRGACEPSLFHEGNVR